MLLQRNVDRVAIKFVAQTARFGPEIVAAHPHIKKIFVARHLKATINSWHKMSQGMLKEFLK